MLSLEPRFNARECTVIPSGASFKACSIEYLTMSSVSFGRPIIKSIFMLSMPQSLAKLKACITCLTECFLPIISRVSWFIVCGLMEILETFCFFKVINLSLVMLSGLPASTVNSFTLLKSKLSFNAFINLSNCAGSSVVGVPPPIYTELSSLSCNCLPRNLNSLITEST